MYNILIKTFNSDTSDSLYRFIGNGNFHVRSSEVCPSAVFVICLVISKWQLYIL